MNARLVVAALALAAGAVPRPVSAQIEVAEATVRELQEAMSSGRATSVQITEAYLARIRAYDQTGPRLNAMIRVNPRALEDASALDAERLERGPRGPLHGIPIILKDNYDTWDMPTTAGTLALAGLMAPDDGFQVRRLREAGAVILGKSNMHELASGITTIGSLGGQTLNPYDLARNPGGSSGGTGAAVAASYAAVGWGSDTCGSIRIPASQNNLFGLRPTKGLSSIDGIVPLAHTQDVGGPLARTAEDLAIALDATVGYDPNDSATEVLRERALPSFVDALDANALRDARIGILEEYFGEAPEDADARGVVRDALERMVELGADTVTVEIADLDSLVSGSSVIGHELKWDLMDYLAGVRGAPVDSLGDMLALGLIHEVLTPYMRGRNEPEERDSEDYAKALAKRVPMREAVIAAMDAAGVDALAYPTLRRPPAIIGEPQRGSSCQLSAGSGLPALSLPAGFTDDGLPIGLELMGRPFDDAHLLALAYAYEQAEKPRRAPWTAPPLVNGMASPPVVFNVRSAAKEPGGAEAHARFTYDPLTGALGYHLVVAGAEPADVFAVVLRTSDEEGRWFVVERLSGPEVVESTGAVVLDHDARRYFEAGELWLELFTREHPFGAGRGRVPWVFER